MSRGYWKNEGRETLCVHPRSLASLHLSSSPSHSFSLSFPFAFPASLCVSFFSFCLLHTLSLHSRLFLPLTYHISAPCGPTGHRIRLWTRSHSPVTYIYGNVLFSCRSSGNTGLFTGTSKYPVILVFTLNAGRYRIVFFICPLCLSV